jgi:hypothetical protein
MTTIPQVARALRQILTTTAAAAGRATRCVQCPSPLHGATVRQTWGGVARQAPGAPRSAPPHCGRLGRRAAPPSAGATLARVGGARPAPAPLDRQRPGAHGGARRQAPAGVVASGLWARERSQHRARGLRGPGARRWWAPVVQPQRRAHAPGPLGARDRAPRRPAPGGTRLGACGTPPRAAARRGSAAGRPGLGEAGGVCRAGAAPGGWAVTAPEADGGGRGHRRPPRAPRTLGEPSHGHERPGRRAGRAPAASGASGGRAGPAGWPRDPLAARAAGGPCPRPPGQGHPAGAGRLDHLRDAGAGRARAGAGGLRAGAYAVAQCAALPVVDAAWARGRVPEPHPRAQPV